MSLNERLTIVRERRLCFNCLGASHWTPKCLITKTCSICSAKHHTLLHRDDVPVRDALKSNPVSSLVGSQSSPGVLLEPALAHVTDYWGHQKVVRVLIDCASHVSAITTSRFNRLGFKPLNWTIQLSGLSGTPVPTVSGVVSCTM